MRNPNHIADSKKVCGIFVNLAACFSPGYINLFSHEL